MEVLKSKVVDVISKEITAHEKALDALKLRNFNGDPVVLKILAERGQAEAIAFGIEHHNNRIAACHRRLAEVEKQWGYKFAVGSRVTFRDQEAAGTVRSRRFENYKITWDDGLYSNEDFNEDDLKQVKKAKV